MTDQEFAASLRRAYDNMYDNERALVDRIAAKRGLTTVQMMRELVSSGLQALAQDTRTPPSMDEILGRASKS